MLDLQILKTLLVHGHSEENPVIALLIRGDHEINALKAEKIALVKSPMTLVNESTLEKLTGGSVGFVGPKGLNVYCQPSSKWR